MVKIKYGIMKASLTNFASVPHVIYVFDFFISPSLDAIFVEAVLTVRLKYIFSLVFEVSIFLRERYFTFCAVAHISLKERRATDTQQRFLPSAFWVRLLVGVPLNPAWFRRLIVGRGSLDVTV